MTNQTEKCNNYIPEPIYSSRNFVCKNCGKEHHFISAVKNYDDEKCRKCSKCGAHFGRMAYHSEWNSDVDNCEPHSINGDPDERLHYYCNICGYDWIEPTKEQMLNEVTKLCQEEENGK